MSSEIATKSQKSVSFSAFIVLICTIAFYSYQYIIRVIPNVIMTDLLEIYSVDASSFSTFAGIYYVGYVVFHIPISIMLLKFGYRKIVSITIFLTGFGLLPIIYSENWMFVLLGRFVSGAGSSGAVLVAFQVFQDLFFKNFSRFLGLMIFFGVLTAFFCGKYLSEIVFHFGIYEILKILLIFSVLLACISYYFFPKDDARERAQHKNAMQEIKAIILNKDVIIISFCAAFMIGPLEGFSDAWGSVFLMEVFHMEKFLADHAVANIFFGLMAGSLVLPYFADRWSIHYQMMLLSAFVMGVAFLILLYVPSIKISGRSVSLFIVGVFCSYQSMFMAIVVKIVPEELKKLVTAIANMILMFFGFFFHKSIGAILDIMWEGGFSASNTKIYSQENFVHAISVIPITLIMSFFVMILFGKKFLTLLKKEKLSL